MTKLKALKAVTLQPSDMTLSALSGNRRRSFRRAQSARPHYQLVHGDPACGGGIHKATPSNTLERPKRDGYQRKLVEDWGQLLPGDVLLLIRYSSGKKFQGTVDDITPDGSVCWLILEQGDDGRKLFHYSDGYRTLAGPRPWEIIYDFKVASKKRDLLESSG